MAALGCRIKCRHVGSRGSRSVDGLKAYGRVKQAVKAGRRGDHAGKGRRCGADRFAGASCGASRAHLKLAGVRQTDQAGRAAGLGDTTRPRSRARQMGRPSALHLRGSNNPSTNAGGCPPPSSAIPLSAACSKGDGAAFRESSRLRLRTCRCLDYCPAAGPRKCAALPRL